MLYSQLPRLRKEVTAKLALKLTPDELDNDSQVVDLKFGSTGAEVIKLQQKLHDKEFKPGAIDGDFGENTQAAVKAFQRSVGLEDDGIVGKKTRAALGLN